MSAWAAVPIYQGTGTPANATIESDGLRIGYNLANRDGWILAGENVPFCKCAYYLGSDQYYYIITAVKKVTPPEVQYNTVWILLYYGSYLRSQVSLIDTYGDYLYFSGAQTQVLDGQRNPDIPAYSTLAEAKDALNDGIWQEITDPYEILGEESEEAGGDGEETEDDPVGDSVHTIPSGGAFYHIFTPSLSQLQSLANYMWGTLDLNNIKRLYANPMDSILGLGVVPLTLSGSNMPVYVGGVDTGLSFPEVSYEVYQVPFGYINVNPRWGSYLDYEPYTKLTVYLPFIGYKEINTDEFMGKQLILNYSVDIVTGSCVARISVSGGSVLYQFSGQCLKQLPVTSGNWDNALRTAISSAAALGATIASQGATAPVLAGAVASASVQALSMKPNIEKSGNLSGMAGMMGGYKPFLLRSQPVQVIPGNQNKFIGYPSFITKTLADISGYNEISSVHLEGIPATGNELAEIESLLKGGVIL